MSKRVGWENADGEDGDDGEELNEAQQEVRDFANEKKRLKKRREVRKATLLRASSLTAAGG